MFRIFRIFTGKKFTGCGNEISIDAIPCDPIRSNYHNDNSCTNGRSDPKYTNTNPAMCFPKFSEIKC